MELPVSPWLHLTTLDLSPEARSGEGVINKYQRTGQSTIRTRTDVRVQLHGVTLSVKRLSFDRKVRKWNGLLDPVIRLMQQLS